MLGGHPRAGSCSHFRGILQATARGAHDLMANRRTTHAVGVEHRRAVGRCPPVAPLGEGDERRGQIAALVVASRTLSGPLEWNASLLEGDVAEAVRKLKQPAGGNLLIYGSGRLVHTLMQYDLIDAFQLMLVPVALGSGQRFFRDGHDPTALSLTGVMTTSTGVVMLTYHRPPRAADRSAKADRADGDWWLRRRRSAVGQ